MASEMIRLLCPNLQCRTLLSVPPIARGKAVRCRACGTRIKIPDQPAPRKAAPAPASPGAGVAAADEAGVETVE